MVDVEHASGLLDDPTFPYTVTTLSNAVFPTRPSVVKTDVTVTGLPAAPVNSSTFKVYKVQALDSGHHVLGTSNAFPSSSSNSGLPGEY